MSSYEEAMEKLSRSGDLACETFYRVVANMAVKSAVNTVQRQMSTSSLDCQDQTQIFHTAKRKETRDDVQQCIVYHPTMVNPIPNLRNYPPSGSKNAGHHPKMKSKVTDISKFHSSAPKHESAGHHPAEKNNVPNFDKLPSLGSKSSSYPPKASSYDGIRSPPDVELDVSAVCVENKIAEEIENQSDGSGYASTGYGTNAVFSDIKSTSNSRKDTKMSQRQTGKTSTGMDHTMRMMGYHMGRISFQCECHFEDLSLSAMSKADRRHCRRFHKGLLGRKKAEEKRDADISKDCQ